MRVTIRPSKAVGSVWAPPSKSVSHRALICGALTDGCTVENVGTSKDVEATLGCLQNMGASVSREGNTVRVGGLDPHRIPEGALLDCGESGSTLRFLLPLCLLSGHKVTLRGHGRLMERPMEVYRDLCRANGFLFEQTGDTLTVCGCLKRGVYTVPGDVSSQFITGLLFALSRVEGESRVEVVGKFESASYVDITLWVLSAFGVTVQRENNAFILNGNQPLSRDTYVVEGDCSNAAFLDAFNLLGGDVKVLGLSPETPQGDRIYQQMYADLASGTKSFDLSDCPDLGPVMFALAAAYGGAEFIGTARLRIKESDRSAAMAQELQKFGIATEIGEDFVRILPGELTAPADVLCGHNDHRIVMALSLLCTVTGGTIEGAQAVTKSYPNFFEEIQSLGIEVLTDDI